MRELRSIIDDLCALLSRIVPKSIILGFVFVAAAVLLLSSTVLAILREPLLGGFVILSIVPAFLLVSYFWVSDPYERTTLLMLSVTYLLGCMVVPVATVVNSVGLQAFLDVPGFGLYIFFFLIVAPVEEALKMVAVFLYGYPRVSNAVAGAVLGAVAGLGFATVENFMYLSSNFSFGYLALQKSTVAGAGTSVGHVIWSSITGYYIGLAKMVPEKRGHDLLKGFLVATFLHATYNTITVGFLGAGVGLGLPIPLKMSLGELSGTAQFVFLAVFFLGTGYYVFRKVEKHRDKIDKNPPVSS